MYGKEPGVAADRESFSPTTVPSDRQQTSWSTAVWKHRSQIMTNATSLHNKPAEQKTPPHPLQPGSSPLCTLHLSASNCGETEPSSTSASVPQRRRTKVNEVRGRRPPAPPAPPLVPKNSLPTPQFGFALMLNRQQGRLNAQMRVTGFAHGSRPNKIQISVQIVAGVIGSV